MEYRLYFFDGAGHIEKAHEFKAADDAAAIKISEAWKVGRSMELWCGNRKVKRWDEVRS
jgi:hypothetical protein